MCGAVTSRSRDPNPGGGIYRPGYRGPAVEFSRGTEFVPTSSLRAASSRGPTHPPPRPPFPSRPPGGLPAAALLPAALGPGGSRAGWDAPRRPGQWANNDPFSPRRRLIPDTAPLAPPQANLLAIQADKTPRPRALSCRAPGHRH